MLPLSALVHKSAAEKAAERASEEVTRVAALLQAATETRQNAYMLWDEAAHELLKLVRERPETDWSTRARAEKLKRDETIETFRAETAAKNLHKAALAVELDAKERLYDETKWRIEMNRHANDFLKRPKRRAGATATLHLQRNPALEDDDDDIEEFSSSSDSDTEEPMQNVGGGGSAVTTPNKTISMFFKKTPQRLTTPPAKQPVMQKKKKPASLPPAAAKPVQTQPPTQRVEGEIVYDYFTDAAIFAKDRVQIGAHVFNAKSLMLYLNSFESQPYINPYTDREFAMDDLRAFLRSVAFPPANDSLYYRVLFPTGVVFVTNTFNGKLTARTYPESLASRLTFTGSATTTRGAVEHDYELQSTAESGIQFPFDTTISRRLYVSANVVRVRVGRRVDPPVTTIKYVENGHARAGYNFGVVYLDQIGAMQHVYPSE